MTLSYDSEADVLYVTFAASVKPQSYFENQEGDIVRIDQKTSTVVGCTIPFFSKRASDGPVIVPQVGAVPFNADATKLNNTAG